MKHLLCTVPIFAGLEDKALEVFLEHARRCAFPTGAEIVKEGETNNSMFIIETGKVAIIKHHGTPNAVELAVLGPGTFFGEACILETLPRSASGIALEPTEAVTVSSSAFYHLYQKMPGQHSILILNMARDLSRRLRHLDEAFAARH